MTDRTFCRQCHRWVGGGVAHDESKHEDEPTHEQLVEQAEAILESVRDGMYFPEAHAETHILMRMIEDRERHDDD